MFYVCSTEYISNIHQTINIYFLELIVSETNAAFVGTSERFRLAA